MRIGRTIVRMEFAWYDLWIGAFIDVRGRQAYVCLVPMCPVVIEW